MKQTSVKMYLILLFITFFSCGKKNSTPETSTNVPTNLVVSAVVNPDNSGNVTITATANNTAAYQFDYGNGISQTLTTGTVTYRYPSSGTYTITVYAKSSTNQSISKSVQVTVTVIQTIVWSDEFNTDGQPDPTKWGYDLGNNSGWGNNELEYYTDRVSNVTVSGGTLKINANRETYSGFNFTSARLKSQGKFSFKYGKIEARAKMPVGVGTWPAIWMLGDNISTVSWPACGEIDIMEHLGRNLNVIYSTMHYPGNSGAGGVGSTTTITNATTAFHTYTAEWDPSSIKFYVDNNLFYTFPNSSALPFNQNFFVILNVALGGNFGGPVDAAFNSSTMEVDYVRVYQ